MIAIQMIVYVHLTTEMSWIKGVVETVDKLPNEARY